MPGFDLVTGLHVDFIHDAARVPAQVGKWAGFQRSCSIDRLGHIHGNNLVIWIELQRTVRVEE